MNFLDYLTGFMETWPAYVAPPFLLKRLTRFELSVPLKYQADGVLTVSDTLADHFRAAGYPSERIKPIYFGFDADLFPMRQASQAPPAERPVVVMHGSFDQHHLKHVALEGLVYAAKRQPALVFRFVGRETPSLLGFVARLKQAVPQAQVELTGFTPYAEVARHLQSATMGIVPYEESNGTHCAFVAKIVEYLAVGLPVVSTPIQSAMRYFQNEPLARFAAFNGERFGQEILNWLPVPLAQQMAWAAPASARVRRELDWRVISRNAADFLERTAAEKMFS
jgi:glycosyltransferase involved in cell wall biosynthesis